MLQRGEVWFVKFPLEENPAEFLRRPVIVLAENLFAVLSVKVTKHAVRSYDSYDVEIIDWRDAGLRMPSTARISKTIMLPQNEFLFKIGKLTNRDFTRVLGTFKTFMDNVENLELSPQIQTMDIFE